MDISIKEKAENILELLRSDEKSSYYSGVLIIIVVLLLGVIFAHYIKFGFSYKLIIGILMLFFFLLLYRMKMLSAFKFSTELSTYTTYKEVDENKYYSGFLNFLESGIDIKLIRVNYIKYLYLLVFPIFLYLLAELVLGLYQGNSFIWAILFAFVISTGVWIYHFSSDVDDWEILKEEVQDMKAKLHL